MRIANKTLFDSIKSSLETASSQMIKAQEVVTTTKRINALSDDPVGLISVLDLRSNIANLDQFGRNISVGSTWLQTCESALTETENLLSDAKELCIQYASANIGSTERRNGVTIVDGFFRQILSLSNTSAGGKYVFSGTENETIPFVLNSGETAVAYNGNSDAFSIKDGKDTNIEVGWNGEDIFGESGTSLDIFNTFINFKTYLTNNDVAGIQSTLDFIDTHLGTIRDTISELGGKAIRLEVRQNIIADLHIAYSERKSKLEDADITEAIMNLSAKEFAYKASLASASKIMTLSLTDYL